MHHGAYINKVIWGDALQGLKSLPDSIVQTCVTSPPYYGLRDYGVEGQIGLEETPEAFTQKLVEVFREVRRVLKDDGTLWLNLGDSYSSGGRTTTTPQSLRGGHGEAETNVRPPPIKGIKPKDLLGIPWRVAFALQADGWYLRQDIIWHKPNPMPESVTDRCTKAHEYIFLLSKNERYYFDQQAIRTPWKPNPNDIKRSIEGSPKYNGKHKDGYNGHTTDGGVIGNALEGANKRSVWTVTTKPYKGAHFATFPPDLVEPCILAGSKRNNIVLDPFAGSGTTGAVAKKHGRQYLLIELNPHYLDLISERLGNTPSPSPFPEAAE